MTERHFEHFCYSRALELREKMGTLIVHRQCEDWVDALMWWGW